MRDFNKEGYYTEKEIEAYHLAYKRKVDDQLNMVTNLGGLYLHAMVGYEQVIELPDIMEFVTDYKMWRSENETDKEFFMKLAYSFKTDRPIKSIGDLLAVIETVQEATQLDYVGIRLEVIKDKTSLEAHDMIQEQGELAVTFEQYLVQLPAESILLYSNLEEGFMYFMVPRTSEELVKSMELIRPYKHTTKSLSDQALYEQVAGSILEDHPNSQQGKEYLKNKEKIKANSQEHYRTLEKPTGRNITQG